MVDKKLVASTVSSRDVGMQRRTEPATTSSHEGKTHKKKTKKNKKRRTEFISLLKARTARKYSIPKTRKTLQTMKREVRQQALKAK